MAATNEELNEIVNRLRKEHGDKAISLASSYLFFRSLSRPFPPEVREVHGAVLAQAIVALADAHSVNGKQILDAIEAMDRASTTINELMSLPD